MTADSAEPRYAVVWPLGRQAGGALTTPVVPLVPLAATAARAARDTPVDLNQATVAFLWNYTRKGDEMFAIARARLRAAYPGVRFVDHGVFGDIHGADEQAMIDALPARLAEHRVDVALIGVGG